MKRLLIILSMAITALLANAKPPQIAVEQFFDGRYNKEKSVRTTITKQDGIYYRGLHVTENQAIVEKISETIAKDATNATKYFEQTGEWGKSVWIKITNNGETIDIGLQQAPSGKTAYLMIRGPEKAFK